MSEEFNSLDTTNDEQTGVVDQSASYDDFAMKETEETSDSQPESVEQDVVEPEEAEMPKKQTREENHAARAARLKAERDAKATIEKVKAEVRAEYDNLMRTSGAKNPYTEKPFKDFNEFREYGKKVKDAEMQDRAEAEGKSIDDIRKEEEDREYIAKKRQEDSERENSQRAQMQSQEKVKNDLDDFQGMYPDVDVSNLITNKNFLKFCGSRLGNEPLADLYTDYVELVSSAEASGKAKDTRGSRSTGSGEGSNAVTLTASQKRDLDAWNRAFPDLAMKPKEYLSR